MDIQKFKLLEVSCLHVWRSHRIPVAKLTPCLQGAEEGAAPLLRHGHPGHQEAEAGQRLRHLRPGIQRQLGGVTGDITMDTFKCIYRMSKYGLLYIVLVLSKNKYWE